MVMVIVEKKRNGWTVLVLGRGLAGSPAGVAGEEAIDKPCLIANEKSEAQAEEA